MKDTLSRFIASQPVLHDCQTLSLRGQLIPLGGRIAALDRGRILLLGDAANLADPWLGEGIFYAIRSARIAADEMINFLKGNLADLSSYTSRINLEIVGHLRQARLLARFIYQFPWIGVLITQQEPFDAADHFWRHPRRQNFRQVNQTLVRQLPTILAQTLRGG